MQHPKRDRQNCPHACSPSVATHIIDRHRFALEFSV
jgi:hypothetical protein